MSAYIIVDIDVTDPPGYEEYKQQAPISVKLYGGKYLVRGGFHMPYPEQSAPIRLKRISKP